MHQHRGVVKPEPAGRELDALDRKLLAALAHNVRLSPSFLGRLVHLSKDGVRYRLEKLYATGTILGTMLVLNPYALGFRFFTLALNIRDPPLEQEQELMAQLALHPNTIWVGQCLGSWNLVVFFIARKDDAKSVEQAIKNICQRSLGKAQLLEITAMHRYQNLPGWFLQEAGMETLAAPRTDASFHKLLDKASVSSGTAELDGLDHAIIRALAPDCRASIAAIAQQLGKPFNTIKGRVQQLIRKQVILACNPLASLSSLHQIAFSAFIELADDGERARLREHLKRHPDTGFLFETRKPWQFEWYGAVRNNIQLHHDLEALRAQFRSIRSITALFIIKDHKLTFTPEIAVRQGAAPVSGADG